MPHPDDPDAPLYTVTQVADIVGVSAATLRRWDREGLASPRRSAGGQRRYSRRQIAQLEKLVELSEDGLNSSGIQRMLDMQTRVSDLEGQLERAKKKRRPQRSD